MRIRIFFGVMVYTFYALAGGTGKDVCLSTSFKKEMGQVRRQGPYAFCGSFTAADQIGQRMGLSGRVSALQVALNGYNVLANGNKYQLLQEKSFKNKMLDNYGVTQTELYHDAALESKKEGLENKGGYASDIMAYMFNLAGEVCLDDSYSSPDENIGYLIQRLEKNLFEKIKSPHTNSCKTSNTYSPEISLVSSPELFYQLLKIELMETCKKRVPIPTYKFVSKFAACRDDQKNKCLNLIHEGLKNNRIVGIGYRTNRLLKPEEIESGNDMHASTIVGRKWNTEKNVCEYEIRNSWGTSCQRYKEESGITCADGYLIVTEDILIEMINDANYLK